METLATIGDLISGRSDLGKNVSSLFAKQTAKPAPVYDYTSIPARTSSSSNKRKNQEEEESEDDIVQKKRKKKEKKTSKNKKQPSENGSTVNKPEVQSGDSEQTEQKEKEEEEGTKKNRMELLKEKFDRVRREEDKERKLDPEKELRTIFVGNLPIKAKEKELRRLFAEFGTVETVRFRSAARPDLKTTKKVAVIKQTFHEARSNINAYIRFKTIDEAERSCSINGRELEGHVLRVDMAEGSGQQHEQSRAVFLGNLDFKTSEDDVRRAFADCGEIADVRLVRDSSTGIGKGFGYINFVSKDSVENALRLNATEVCGRKVRVSRAVRKPKPGSGHQQRQQLNSKKPFPGKQQQLGNRPAAAGAAAAKKSWANKAGAANNFNRAAGGFKKQFRKKFDKKEQQVKNSFQGLTTTSAVEGKKFKKPRWNKADKKKKILAEKLAS